MKKTQAINIRTRQLQGLEVDPIELQAAMRAITTNQFDPEPKAPKAAKVPKAESEPKAKRRPRTVSMMRRASVDEKTIEKFFIYFIERANKMLRRRLRHACVAIKQKRFRITPSAEMALEFEHQRDGIWS